MPVKDHHVPDYLHNEEVNKLKFKVHIQPLLFFFYYFQPKPTCLAVVCARAEPQPWPATCRRKRSCWRAWLCCLRRGLPRLWPWPDDGSGLWKGPSCSIMTACKFLISPTNTLETPTQRLFPDLRSISPTGEFLPAAYVLWRAILWWLDIFHSRPALKQQNRQGNKPWPLSGAALFWFDFFSFFCKLRKLLWVYRTLFSITPTGFQTVISFSKHSIELYGVVGIASFHPFPFLLHWPQIHFIWLPATLSFCCLLPSPKWNQRVIFFLLLLFFATVITL